MRKTKIFCIVLFCFLRTTISSPLFDHPVCVCFLTTTVPPGPPNNLRITKVGPDFITLEWKPPLEDGGAKVTGFRLEFCDEKSDDWVKVADLKQYDTSYKVTNLKDTVGYLFAVSAQNSAGYGEPCETERAVRPKRPEGRQCAL